MISNILRLLNIYHTINQTIQFQHTNFDASYTCLPLLAVTVFLSTERVGFISFRASFCSP